MSDISRFDMEIRLRDFPDAIRNVARSNAVVCRILEEYTAGGIITREEALCRMVVELARSDSQRLNQVNRVIPAAFPDSLKPC